MNTTTPTIGALPWYRSPQQIGLVTTAASAFIALFPKVGQLLGWTSPGDVANGVTAFFGAIAIIAPIIGTFIRARSPVQPLTLTASSAEVHPATLAANATAVTNQRNANIAAVQKAQPKVTP
jgi:hypothetical protein